MRSTVLFMMVAALAGCGGGGETNASDAMAANDAMAAGDAMEVDGGGASTDGATVADGGADPDGQVSPDASARDGGAVDGSAMACGVLGFQQPLFVDPVLGDDLSPGTNAAPGCRMKTLTMAVERVRAMSPAFRPIVLLGDASWNTGERFPIRVPSGVHITGARLTTGSSYVTGLRQVSTVVPTSEGQGRDGFVLEGSNIRLQGLEISGGAGSAGPGLYYGKSAIVVQAAGPQVEVLVSSVLIHHMGRAGIVVGGPDSGAPLDGDLRLAGTVEVHDNGTAADPADGILVMHRGRLRLGYGAFGNPISASRNTRNGISVLGQITIDAGNYAVYTTDNASAGVAIARSGGSPPLNQILNLSSYNNAGGGLRVTSGAALQLRNGTFRDNSADVVVEEQIGGSTDLDAIDLGRAGDPGHNHFLASATSTIGLCVNLPLARFAGEALDAVGNTFGVQNCETGTPQLAVITGCVSSTPVPIGVNEATPGAITINVSQCGLQRF